jgi:hypothetical protein
MWKIFFHEACKCWFKVALMLVLLTFPIVSSGSPKTTSTDKSKNASCRAYFAVKWLDFNDPNTETMATMSSEQLEWWLKHKEKEFLGLCPTTSMDRASYVIHFIANSEVRQYQYDVPKTETTYHNGTVNANTSSIDGSSSNTTGTYSGTSRTTHYEKETREWKIVRVGMGVRRVKDGVHDDYPIHVAEKTGEWRWATPEKDLLVNALKFIEKDLKRQ